jgi:hypothetical protein
MLLCCIWALFSYTADVIPSSMAAYVIKLFPAYCCRGFVHGVLCSRCCCAAVDSTISSHADDGVSAVTLFDVEIGIPKSSAVGAKTNNSAET